jgi:hypothetical protein
MSRPKREYQFKRKEPSWALFSLYKVVKGGIFIHIIQIHPVPLGVRIQTTKGDIVVRKGLMFVLNALCLSAGSTYQGRIQAAKQCLQQERLVPLYVNASTVLIMTHSVRRYECQALNVFALQELSNESFLKTEKARQMIEKALKVHQFFESDYDIMKYLKGLTTDEEKNNKRP